MKAKYLILSFFTIGCKAVERNEAVSEKGTFEAVSERRTFANQGKYDNYLAEQHFSSEDYKPEQYQKFEGVIFKDSLNEKNIVYFDSLRVIISEQDDIYRRFFTDNILNPKYLYTSQSMKICCFKEYTQLNKNGTHRRFRFWVFEEGLANPLQYLLELRNNKATSQTSLSEFLEEAEMTYLSEPTVVI